MRTTQRALRKCVLCVEQAPVHRIRAMYALDPESKGTRETLFKLLHSPNKLGKRLLPHVFTCVGRVFNLQDVQDDMHRLVLGALRGRYSLTDAELAAAIELDEKELSVDDLELALQVIRKQRRFNFVAIQFVNWVRKGDTALIEVLRRCRLWFSNKHPISPVIDGTLMRVA